MIRVNDESDACRHYVWAILLAKNLNLKNAEIILNAHENNPLEPEDEKAMDVANNRIALIDFSKYDSNVFDEKFILTLFKENLEKKKLIVLKPRFSNSKGVPQ